MYGKFLSAISPEEWRKEQVKVNFNEYLLLIYVSVDNFYSKTYSIAVELKWILGNEEEDG